MMMTTTPPPLSVLDEALARWLATGFTCLGQIAVTPLPDGGYELRHREDAARPADELISHPDPEDAATLALLTDTQDYRPLKTAPNLCRGWRLEMPDLPALRLALDRFYPARLGAFLLREQGRLPVTSLRETLGRQTGMYRVTQKLTDAQADALVARVCRSDGGCLRTVLWKLDAAGASASTGLPPEKFDPAHDQTGAGARAVPLLCQEACNLLVAEARAVVKGERSPAG